MTLKIQKFFSELGSGLLAIIKVVLLSKFRTEIRYSVRDKSCIILGNGPSLESMLKEYPGFLESKDIICVNHFPSTSYYEKLKPAFYITSAPDLWLDNIDEKFIRQSDELFSAMARKTSWDIQFLVPFEAERYERWKKDLKENPGIRFIHYNNIGIEGWKGLRHYFYRRNLAMPRPHNVIISAIYTAINLGYQEIYIWGAEHTQFKEITVDENNNALINQKHFYDYSESKAEPLDKRGKGERKVHEILYKFMVAFRSYFVLREYSDSRGVRILNATPGSLIDAFERFDNKRNKANG